jgi:flagellar FliL protein
MSAAVLQPEAGVVPEAAKGSKKKLLIGLVVLLLAVGGAGYWFLLKPAPGAPQPGAVAPLDQIQVNLAEGHYLRLGIALQLTKGTKEVDGSQALDAAIDLFTGLPIARLDQRASRERLRTSLERTLEKDYDGEVMDVYFTEFVTQ